MSSSSPPDGPGSPGPTPSAEVLGTLFPDSTAISNYVDLLISQGILRGLIGPSEVPRLWERHILNCAVVAPLLPHRARVCDIGSGAGLPGIVLALARPDLRLTLLEPLERRVDFLNEALRDLGLLEQVEVRRGRAPDDGERSGYQVVTARAVAPLGKLLGWALPLIRPGGELLAIKGRRAEEELSAALPILKRSRTGTPEVLSLGAGIVDPQTVVVRIPVTR